MSPIEKLIIKSQKNYDLIANGKRSIAKGKALNEAANVMIRLTLLQLTHSAKFPSLPSGLLSVNETDDILLPIESSFDEKIFI